MFNQNSVDSLAQVEEINDKYEIESGISLDVKGNLKKKLTFWRTIGAPHFILTITDNGYGLPFVSLQIRKWFEPRSNTS